MQASFSDLEYDAKKRLTRRDRFLAEIEAVTPWTLLVAELEPFYPKGEGRGRPPIGLEKMLRMYSHSNALGFPMRRLKMRCTTAKRFAALSVWISDAKAPLTQRPC